MNNWRLLGLMIILAGVVLLATVNEIEPTCRQPYRHDKTIAVNGKKLSVEVADDESERERGLSGRQCLGEDQAMLFVFDRPGYYNFWMKNMNFPIDFVWIGQDKRVVEVTDNISPSTYPDTFASLRPTRYVLELPAGRSAELSLSEGSRIEL